MPQEQWTVRCEIDWDRGVFELFTAVLSESLASRHLRILGPARLNFRFDDSPVNICFV
jgi:hypothetical protein